MQQLAIESRGGKRGTRHGGRAAGGGGAASRARSRFARSLCRFALALTALFPAPRPSSYLTELLLDKGYIVHGLKRRASSYNHPRLEHIMDASEWPGEERRRGR